MLTLDCKCGSRFTVADSRAGRNVVCPNCGQALIASAFVPTPAPDSQMTPEEARALFSGVIKDILWWIVLLPFKIAFGIVAMIFANPKGSLFLAFVAFAFYAINCQKR